ncbi:BnaA10g27600D [Brassica napus]|uniref:BnaA10g27600D protein n=1 Tax=Brassica napus TaxID=3708 RepID=A0A078HU66_BRANA|nr:BnaA10g27600D [Brassica napus]
MARLSNFTCGYVYCLNLLFKAKVHLSQEDDENIFGSNEGDSALKTPPSVPSVLGEKVGEEFGTADPPEITVTRNNRKRSRE